MRAAVLLIIACGSPALAPAPASSCPHNHGQHAEWPDGERPAITKGIGEVCLAKPASGCESMPPTCILEGWHCGIDRRANEVLETLPTKEPDLCCWKVKGDCTFR